MLKRLSIGILIAATLITGFAVYRLTKIGFDYNFESFFPRRDKDTDFFKEHRQRFGTDNDFVLIGLKNESGIFQKEFLRKVKVLADSLHSVKDVKEVISIIDLNEPVRDPLMGSMYEIPYLRYETDSLYAIDSARIYGSPELVGNLVSGDGKSVAIMINHTELIKDQECADITNTVQSLIRAIGFDDYHVAGRCVGQAYYTSVMKIDLVLLLGVAFVVIIILMIFIYRTSIGVVLPLVTVGISVIWSMAFMELTGKRIDVLTNAIPTILVVVGLSVSVHVVTKYMDHLREGWTKFEALRNTILHVGLANIFTTLTTVVGFASLATSGIKPIDDFGLYTAAGVLMSFVVGYTVLPSLLFLLPQPKLRKPRNPKISWHNFLINIFTFLINRKRSVIYGTVAIALLFIGGAFLIRENTYLLEDLSEKDRMKKDFVYFEHEFQGTRPFEMSITVKDTATQSVFDRNVLVELEKMQNYLSSEYGLGFILSPVTLVKNANKSLSGGSQSDYKIPTSDSKLRRISNELFVSRNNPQIKALITEDFNTARIRSIFADVGSNEANQRNKKFYAFMEANIDPDLFDYKLTGTAELIDKNNRNLTMNIAQGLIIAFVLVSIILAILYKSWKMVLIGILPNIIPLLMLAGTMGFIGISMKMSTAILFTIAFGIAVDDTIHFLSKLRMELREEKHLLYALKRTFLTAGKAMFITTILLCAGFLVLALSSFQAVKIIGVMVSFTLFLALISDLVFLPVLIMLFFKVKKERTVIPQPELEKVDAD